jgi:hypothetical protein
MLCPLQIHSTISVHAKKENLRHAPDSSSIRHIPKKMHTTKEEDFTQFIL